MSKNIIAQLKIMLVIPVLLFSFGMVTVPSRAYAISDQSIIQLTNNHRTMAGLVALAWNGKLSNSAWLKAQDMCTKNYWSHTGPDGSTGWTFMSKSGYAYTTAGENLAKGFSDDSSVVDGWMASPGHRANILNATYAEVGVASMTCDLQGSVVTLVVAHYGITGYKTAPSTTVAKPVISKKIKPQTSVKTLTSAIPSAPVPTPAPVQPKFVVKLTPELGTKVWSLIWHNLLDLRKIASFPE